MAEKCLLQKPFCHQLHLPFHPTMGSLRGQEWFPTSVPSASVFRASRVHSICGVSEWVKIMGMEGWLDRWREKCVESRWDSLAHSPPSLTGIQPEQTSPMNYSSLRLTFSSRCHYRVLAYSDRLLLQGIPAVREDAETQSWRYATCVPVKQDILSIS